ncbi:MAG: NAD-binding protein [Armatimonadota bacterium]|nr:NAD-binding protein [Armatimonadota bacterium]
MKVVILGCGRVGSTMARMLSREGHSVTIIDWNADSFRRLGSEPDPNIRTIVGSGTEVDVLKKAGIETADAFVAVTNGDNTNIMSVQIAKEIFKAPKVLARIYDPVRATAYHQLGIETLCTTSIGAGLMTDFLLGKEPRPVLEYCEIEDELNF